MRSDYPGSVNPNHAKQGEALSARLNEEIPEERLIGFTDLEHCLASLPIWKVPNGLQGDGVYHLDWLSRLPLSDEIRLSRMAYKLDHYRRFRSWS